MVDGESERALFAEPRQPVSRQTYQTSGGKWVKILAIAALNEHQLMSSGHHLPVAFPFAQTLIRAESPLKLVQIDVKDWGYVQRHQLGYKQAAHHSQTKRLPC